MKKQLFTFCLFAMAVTDLHAQSGSVSIGTISAAPSAKLDVNSTTQGFAPPRMTTAQRNAIASPVAGLTIFNTTSNCVNFFADTWQDPCAQLNVVTGHQKIDSLYGGSGNDQATSIQQTTDGGYIVAGISASSASGNVTGTTNGSTDFWVVKLDAIGAISWNKLLGGTGSEQAFCVQQTADGGYIIAGSATSSATGNVTGTSNGGTDAWIVKLDASGNVVSNKLLGGSGDEAAYSIQQTADGGYIIGGYTTSPISGNVTTATHGSFDYWIVKLDASFNIVWNKTLGGTTDDYAYAIQQTSDGGYIVSGSSTSSATGNVTGTNHGTGDCWIVRLNALGTIVWNKLLGGINDDKANSVLQSADGGFIVGGFSGSSANGDVTDVTHGANDAWIIKLDALGAISWNKLFGGSGADVVYSIRQTTDGGYIAAGNSASSATGNITTTNHGSNDYWIIKMDAAGNLTWNKLLGGTGDDAAYAVEQTVDGGYVMVGYSNSTASGDVVGANHGGYDYWVLKLNALGSIIH